MKTVFNTRNKFFLVSLILIGSFVFFLPVKATETSSVEITGSDDDIIIESITITPAVDATDETDSSEPASEEGDNSELLSLDLESSSDDVVIDSITITTPEETDEETTISILLGDEDSTSSAGTISVDSLSFNSENIVVLSDSASTTTSTTETTGEETSTSTPEVVEEATSTITTTTTALTTTTIHFQIETYDATLYNDNFVVTECPDTENGATTTLNIWCAIQQLGEQQDWETNGIWGPYGVTYDINQYKGNDFSDSMWWGWYSNLSPGWTGVNAHLLSEDENILLTYGIKPSKLKISNIEPEINTTTTIEFQKYDWSVYDWAPITSSTLVVNDEEIFDADGIYELEITTTTPYEIYAKKTGFINTEILSIIPQLSTEASTTTDTTTTTDETAGGTGGTGGSNSPSDEENEPELVSQTSIDQTIEKILNYYKSQQDETGKIVDGNITDWAILSFGADGQYADDIKLDGGKSLLEYEKEYNLDSPRDMNSCITYPRHILALLSAGVKTDDPAIIGLKENIYDEICYSNNLYGLNGINDDVFALLALLALDTDTTENIIQDTITEIKTWQIDSGAFTWPDWYNPSDKVAGDDITGVVINALNYAKERGAEIDSTIIDQAVDYLKTSQQTDGGWGYDSSDVMTTSWVLMGVNSLGETQADWFNDEEKNPWHAMTEQLNEDGYYESAWVPGTVDWFAMQYAVPALAGTSWPIVLDPIVEDFSAGATFTYGGGGSGSIYIEPEEIVTTTSTPTTTLDIDLDIETTTSTPTTTLEILEKETPTSTVEILDEIVLDEKETQIPLPVIQKNPNYNPPAASAITQTNSEIIGEDKNDKEEEEKTVEIVLESTGETLSASNSSTIPYSKTTKGVFAGATSMAGALGLYLGWRFLQTLV